MATAAAIRHPIHYTVFQPNVLIGANSEMKLLELRIYTELLNFNHRENPNQLKYFIPYESITSSEGRDVSKNAKREFMRLTKQLQKRIFDLDEDFMQTHFGKNYPATLVAFPLITYEDNGFEINLEPHFKQILVRLEIGFTKGDVDLLRTFRHTYSHRLYWIIRQNQWRESEITLEIDKLKEALGCAGKYKAFQNFKTKVLNPVKEEFRGTWVEFEYTLVRRGRGGAVKAITLHFNNDLQQTLALKLGQVYKFEHILANYQLHAREIKKVRQKVALGEELRPGYAWSEAYVNEVIELVKETYRIKNRTKGAEPIRKMGPYLLKVLTEGWYIDKVEARREAKLQTEKAQLNVFEDQPKLRPEPKQKPFQTSYESFREMYELHKEIHQSNLSETEYAKELGYRIQGNVVIKME